MLMRPTEGMFLGGFVRRTLLKIGDVFVTLATSRALWRCLNRTSQPVRRSRLTAAAEQRVSKIS